MNQQKKQYQAPRAEVLGLGAPSHLLTASSGEDPDAPDISDKGDSGDGSDLNNAKSAYLFDEDPDLLW